jgi:hypothetical protein
VAGSLVSLVFSVVMRKPFAEADGGARAGSHSGYGALPDQRYWRPTPGCLPLGSRFREPAATPAAAGSFCTPGMGSSLKVKVL